MSDGKPPPLPPRVIGYAGPPPAGVVRDPGQDPGMRMLMPVGRSGWAIASGYLGLLSPLLAFAPFAVWTGIMAVREIKRDPSRHGMGRAVFGIAMGGLFTAVGIIAIVAVAVGR